jgi:4-diphosphocytidyl-2-C-methyl-D-erythritol kinase
VRLESFAKLNLYLRVLNRRPDSYHNINTLFERISLHDTVILTLRRDGAINIKCRPPLVPSDKTNLAFRAAKILQDGLGVKRGAEIKIIKRIPIGAGLGGGSSNAAAVLMGLNRLWGLKLSRRRLLKYARTIGSDVAFFIYDCPFAEGRGRGDKIKPLTSLRKVRLWQVVVVPHLAVATAGIYRQWDRIKLRLTRSGSNVKILSLALKEGNRSLINRALFNNLEPVTTRLYPEIQRIKDEFLRMGREGSLMSGSGSAVFALAGSRKNAFILARHLKREKRPWRVFVSHTS